MNRRQFMMAATVAALGGAKATDSSVSLSNPQRPTLNAQPTPRNRHPYQGIDWATAHQIRGTTHVHCTNQADLDEIKQKIVSDSVHYAKRQMTFFRSFADVRWIDPDNCPELESMIRSFT